MTTSSVPPLPPLPPPTTTTNPKQKTLSRSYTNNNNKKQRKSECIIKFKNEYNHKVKFSLKLARSTNITDLFILTVEKSTKVNFSPFQLTQCEISKMKDILKLIYNMNNNEITFINEYGYYTIISLKKMNNLLTHNGDDVLFSNGIDYILKVEYSIVHNRSPYLEYDKTIENINELSLTYSEIVHLRHIIEQNIL